MYDIRVFMDYDDFSSNAHGNGGLKYINVSPEDTALVIKLAVGLGCVVVLMPAASGDEE